MKPEPRIDKSGNGHTAAAEAKRHVEIKIKSHYTALNIVFFTIIFLVFMIVIFFFYNIISNTHRKNPEVIFNSY